MTDRTRPRPSASSRRWRSSACRPPSSWSGRTWSAIRTSCGPGRISRELEECHRVIAGATGHSPRAFRAPHGYRNPFVTFAANRLGYTVFGWTFGVFDSACPGSEEIRRRVRKRLRPGAIILLHDGDGYDASAGRRQTADALPGIIRDARDAGYQFRPLGELIPGLR